MEQFKVENKIYTIKNGKVYDVDNNVAVLVSHSGPMGWSTFDYTDPEELLYYPKMVKYILEGGLPKDLTKDDEILTDLGDEIYEIFNPIALTIYWVKPGRIFRVRETYGGERLEYYDPKEWQTT